MTDTETAWPEGRDRSSWLVTLALVLTAAVFAKSLGGGYVYDDLYLVERNPSITSFAKVQEVFTQPYWGFRDARNAENVGYWRPLTAVGLTAGHELLGGKPWSYHLLSLLAHLGATAVAFRFVRRLTGSAAIGFWTALLFGLHPVHVESVAWISALNDPLFGLFALLSLDAFLAWRRAGSHGVPLGAALWLVPALLSKELALAVVPIALALDLTAASRPSANTMLAGGTPAARGLRAYAPFLVVLVSYWGARVFVFGDLAAGFDRTPTSFELDADRALSLRFEILGTGLALMTWPSGLSLFHPFRPELAYDHPDLAIATLACFALVGLTVTLLLRSRRSGVAAACAALLLAIPAGLAPALLRAESVGDFPVSERFLYLPVLGLAGVLCAAVVTRLPRPAASGALALVAAGYALVSWQRIDVWENEETLFRASVAESPRSPYVQWGLGRVLLDRFRVTDDPDLIEEALTCFTEAQDLAISKAPDVYYHWHDLLQANLGVANCHFYAAQHDAYEDFETPKEIFRQLTLNYPQAVEAHTGYGRSLMALDQREEAIEAFQRALALDDRDHVANTQLGLAYIAEGRWDLARRHLERSLAQKENNVPVMLALAGVEAEDGLVARATSLAEAALELAPDDPAPRVALGSIEARREDWSSALRWFDEALSLAPDDGEAHLAKGKVLVAMQEYSEAIVEFRRAADALPKSYEAHYNLGALLALNGANDAALPFLEHAYTIGSEDASISALRGSLAQLRPDDAEASYRLARLDHGRGQLFPARFWLERTLASDPEHAPALFLMAQILRSEGQPEQAVATLERCLEEAPEFFSALRELGELYAEAGRREEALEVLRKASALGPPRNTLPGLAEVIRENLERQIDELEASVGPLPSGG